MNLLKKYTLHCFLFIPFIVVFLFNQNVDADRRQHFQGGGPGRLREGMRIHAQEKRPVDPVLLPVEADRLGDREDMGLVEAALEGGAAMAAGPERHALLAHRGIGALGIVGRHQSRNVDQHRGRRRFSC